MTSSIPDSISNDDLMRLAKQASDSPNEVGEDKLPCGFTAEQIQAIAFDACADVHKKVNDPIIAKAVMYVICTQMIEWHTQTGISMFADDQSRSGVCWLRDAGKFQSILNILNSISLGDSDFMHDDD